MYHWPYFTDEVVRLRGGRYVPKVSQQVGGMAGTQPQFFLLRKPIFSSLYSSHRESFWNIRNNQLCGLFVQTTNINRVCFAVCRRVSDEQNS